MAIDPNSRSFPILSYVMARILSLSRPRPPAAEFDIEQSAFPSDDPSPSSSRIVNECMPLHLSDSDPKVLSSSSSMTSAISDVAHTRSVLKTLGERPDHEAVDTAKAKLADVDLLEWRTHEYQQAADQEKQLCKAIVHLDEMHDAYEKMLKEAEEKVKIYDSSSAADGDDDVDQLDPINEEVVRILQEANEKEIDRINLFGRRLRFLPEEFGRIRGLVALDISRNQLQIIPDSVSALKNLEELNVSSNLLESLPDSIGLLQNLKLLNVSRNKLRALPESICHCRSLVELDASFNRLTYLPTNMGHELVNLQKLFIHLNKIRSLPSSVCGMSSLRCLDAHFNQLRGLPQAIGKLTQLEYLNLACNFTDLTELPHSFGDLWSLSELDLSNNQIHALPSTFCHLENLKKLNLEQNPLVTPPMEVVNGGLDAVRTFMSKKWLEILEEKRTLELMDEQARTGWLRGSTSWLKTYVFGSSKSHRDPYLDEQL